MALFHMFHHWKSYFLAGVIGAGLAWLFMRRQYPWYGQYYYPPWQYGYDPYHRR